jgi:hypothetical protein
MANLDKQLSPKVKQHQLEEKRMKYIITQLVNQKQEPENKLAKTTLSTIPSNPQKLLAAKLSTTKPPALSSLTLKKPSPKSNVKYIPVTPTEALTLKTPVFIKFN